MAYWNHFSESKYEAILFNSLKIGEKFRNNFWKGKRRRRDIICIKTGELSSIEEKSKKEHTMMFLPDNYYVQSFDKLKPQIR